VDLYMINERQYGLDMGETNSGMLIIGLVDGVSYSYFLLSDCR
jgi:hypothetical protein